MRSHLTLTFADFALLLADAALISPNAPEFCYPSWIPLFSWVSFSLSPIFTVCNWLFRDSFSICA